MKYTKAMKKSAFYARLSGLGFGTSAANGLRRIEMTLQRWGEAECNGEIERDGDQCEGRPFRRFGNYLTANDPRSKHFIPDREAGALRRLAAIMADYENLIAYYQTDPRGCALYIVRKSDLPDGGSIDCHYSRGAAVCF